MTDIANRPVLNGPDLETAIEHARTALAAALSSPSRGPGGWGDAPSSPMEIAEARARLGALLEHRLALTAERTGAGDLAAIAAVRADRDEAIAVHGALLYWLPDGDSSWSEVAMTVGRLSYDRYSDPWPDAEAPDPDDLDAACDLLLRAAPGDEADERTARYLVLALRDRRHLLACPTDTSALMAWGERLLAFPDAGGLGRAGLHDLLERSLRLAGFRTLQGAVRGRARRWDWGTGARSRTPARAGSAP
jgi:hypothetical protein